jgi:hypothetical protein
MSNLFDKIITVFLDKQASVLKDTDISLLLIAQGIQCYTEDIRRHVQTLSPALFRLTVSNDNTITVRVDPTVNEFPLHAQANGFRFLAR